MSAKDVRTGILTAEQNKSFYNFVIVEIFILAIGLGIYFQSWAVGIGTLIALIVVAMVPMLRVIYSVGIASVCAYVAYVAGKDQESIEIFAICLLVWMIVYSIHHFGMKTLTEIGEEM